MEEAPSPMTPRNNTEHLRMMITAVDAVITGRMSQREAAKAYNIPRSTLRSHLPKHAAYKHRIQKPPANFKGKTILSKKEEKELVDFVINMHRAGFGRTRQDVLYKVQDMLNKAERKTKFENNLPNDEWCEAFLERHKDSVKQCYIGCGSQERGVIPLDVYSVNQAIEVAVQSVQPVQQVQVQQVPHPHVSQPSHVFHHSSPPPPPQHLVYRPPPTPESISRCRTLPFSLQL